MNKFDDIKHTPLRVYNRVVYTSNLLEDAGEGAARAYLELFDEQERKEMFVMQQFILVKGKEAAQKAVTKDVEFENVADQEDSDEQAE